LICVYSYVSKKDVALTDQKATLSTNDIVINKLTQILSYLRAGTRTKKKKKVNNLFSNTISDPTVGIVLLETARPL
jgi:hypothetical protein